MIHILLTILKVLGILLLVLLGIILFVVLAVLFVPFRYSISGEKYKKDKKDDLYEAQVEEQQVIKAKVVVSWLAHLVHFRFRLQNQEKDVELSQNAGKKSKIKTDMELFLFGIPVFALKNKISANGKNSKVKAATAKKKDNLTQSVKEKAASQDAIVEESTDAALEERSENSPLEEVTVEPDKNSEVCSAEEKEAEPQTEQNSDEDELAEILADGLSQTNSTNQENQAEVKQNPIKKLLQKICGIPEKIKASIEKIKLTIKKICDKIKKGSDFLKKESTKATIRLIFGKLKNIIVHILPKKLKGYLIFGFDDPALTGEILGVASLFYPKYQKTFKLIPMFEQQVLEGKVQIKGRIVVAYLVWQVIKILLDKNARLTFKNIKRLAAELKK